MAYIGHSPTNAGTFYILDDLTMGAGTTYGLAVGGVSVSPSADNLLITLDGVIQHPTDAYTVSGSNIVFASGPGSGVEFYGIIMGQSASTGQGSIGADELKVSGDGSSGQVLTSDGDGTFSWATDTENYLPLAGGTMSGAINLGSQNVTNGGTITGTFVGNITGNVTGNVSGTAAAGTLTGSTLASGVTASSLESVGTLTGLTIENATNPLVVGSGTKDLYFDPDSNGVMVSTATSQGGDGHYYNDASGEVWTTIDGTAKVKVKASAFEVTPDATFAGTISSTITGGHVQIDNGVGITVSETMAGKGHVWQGSTYNVLSAGAVSIGSDSSNSTHMWWNTYDTGSKYNVSTGYGMDMYHSKTGGEFVIRMGSVNTVTAGDSQTLTEALKIESDGDVVISKRIMPDADGTRDLGDNTKSWRKVYTDKILFNGDTADANALDDYEEGTFTPANAHISVTNNSTGQYIKVGKLVTFWCDVTFADSPADTSQSGGYLTGLPFTSETVSGAEHFIPHMWWSDATTGAMDDNTAFEVRIESASSSISIHGRVQGYIATRAQMASSRMHFTGTYQATD